MKEFINTTDSFHSMVICVYDVPFAGQTFIFLFNLSINNDLLLEILLDMFMLLSVYFIRLASSRFYIYLFFGLLFVDLVIQFESFFLLKCF